MEIREDKKDWMLEVLGTERFGMLERIIDEYGSIATAMGIPSYESEEEVQAESQTDEEIVKEDAVEDETDVVEDVVEEETVEAEAEAEAEADEEAVEDEADVVEEEAVEEEGEVALDFAGMFKEFSDTVSTVLVEQAEATKIIAERINKLESKISETEELVKEFGKKEGSTFNDTLARMFGASGVLESAVGSGDAKLRSNSRLAKDDGPDETKDVSRSPVEDALASIIGI